MRCVRPVLLTCAVVLAISAPLLAQPVLPNVIGQDVTQAGQTLARMGYIVHLIYSDVPNQNQHDKVLSQAPAGGQRVPPTQPVTLQVGRYTAVKVPSIIGRSIPDAGVMLPAAGLVARVSGQVSTTEAFRNGTIASQKPQAGAMVPKGTVVEFAIYVSTTVAVPRVTNMSFDEAVRTLQALGLTYRGGCQPRPGKTLVSATVTSQSPSPGSSMQKGGTVVFAATECRWK